MRDLSRLRRLGLRRRIVAAAAVSNITFVGSHVAAATNGGAPSLPFSSLRDANGLQPTILQNDLVIAGWSVAGHGDQTMVPTTAGYTEIGQDFVGSGFMLNGWVGRKLMGATPDTSLTLPGYGGSTTSASAGIFVFRGVDPTTPLDVVAVAAKGAAPAGTNKPNPGAITPATGGSWVAVIGLGSAQGNPLTGTNYTNPGDLDAGTNSFRSTRADDNNSAYIGMGFKDDWSSGAFDPAAFSGGATDAANNNWMAWTLALRSS